MGKHAVPGVATLAAFLQHSDREARAAAAGPVSPAPAPIYKSIMSLASRFLGGGRWLDLSSLLRFLANPCRMRCTFSRCGSLRCALPSPIPRQVRLAAVEALAVVGPACSGEPGQARSGFQISHNPLKRESEEPDCHCFGLLNGISGSASPYQLIHRLSRCLPCRTRRLRRRR